MERFIGITQPIFDIAIPSGGLCGGKSCWKDLSGKGYLYKEKSGEAADGVTTMKFKPASRARPRFSSRRMATSSPFHPYRSRTRSPRSSSSTTARPRNAGRALSRSRFSTTAQNSKQRVRNLSRDPRHRRLVRARATLGSRTRPAAQAPNEKPVALYAPRAASVAWGRSTDSEGGWDRTGEWES